MQKLRVEAEPAFRTRAANPYNARLYTAVQALGVDVEEMSRRRILTGDADIVHLHWPELTFLSGHRTWRKIARLIGFYTALAIARRSGTRLVWTAHNIAGRESGRASRVQRWSESLLLRNVDAVFALTRGGVDAAREAFPALRAVPAFVTPHGHYRDDYDLTGSRTDARARLGLDATVPVIAFFGQLRAYKNVPHLIRVFREAAHRDSALSDAVLLVSGRPRTPELEAELRDAAGDDERVRLSLTFQDDDRIAELLAATDLVALPYSEIQNSGSAILALSASRPILVPALGAMGELGDTVGEDWVRTFDGDLTAASLTDAVAWSRSPGRPAEADLDALDWADIAVATVNGYRAVLAAPRIPPTHRSGRSVTAAITEKSTT